MSCAQMSITPTIDEPPKEDEVEESERGTEEVSEVRRIVLVKEMKGY